MKILIGVTGGIAAYKSLELVRLFIKAQHEVQVVMTDGAKEFIQPLSFQALSGKPVRDGVFNTEQEAGMGHIELARWADLIVIAPATAETIAKLRMGRADNLLTTICLATNKPIMLAPAMNSVMWKNEATIENIEVLTQREMIVLQPASGEQACGEVGEGRMLEAQAIFDLAIEFLIDHTELKKYWQGKKLLITAGPTFEDIDPVRFIANKSSGKMGFAIAEVAASVGAEVTLITGPVSLNTPLKVIRKNVHTATQMFEEIKKQYLDADYFISAAAVADYRVDNPQKHKIKKMAKQENLTIELVKTPDIVAWVASKKQQHNLKVIGFAAETQQLLEYAKQKLVNKNLDMICANLVGEGKGFEQQQNQLTLISQSAIKELNLSSKKQQAFEILNYIAKEKI
jgi:phosphopantothenoylcysteine decarboxylase/phosphopantothenate--cysteine ligase